LVVLGITQEQHADRCRLFAQWKGLDWPILHDPINQMQSRAVPLFVAIDENGIVRSTRARVDSFESEFLDVVFEGENGAARGARAPDWELLERHAKDPEGARTLADALISWGGPEKLNDAIAAYERAVGPERKDADALFRLGVAFRMRHESQAPEVGDFQRAVEHWQAALALDPDQYIWRRRIEQYGPRLSKPYPFYDWVEEATEAIATRGEQPIELAVSLTGSEIAQRARAFEASIDGSTSPDPDGRIRRDAQGLITAEIALVPPEVQAGKVVRVHVTMRPDLEQEAWWNNESEPLRVWVEGPQGVRLSTHLLTAPPGERAETREVRRLDFEVEVPVEAKGSLSLKAYALYNVCEDQGGTCQFLRRDLDFEIEIAD
jgi:tetratricopeptide (TPR) repeat protein